MSVFAPRTDTSIVGRWWWTVDRWTLAALMALILAGLVLALAATPPVAERLGYDTYYFVRRQVVYLVLALGVMFTVSMLGPRGVRRLAVAVFVAALVLTAATVLVGVEVKGASRWLRLGGLSLQPSEFVKPAFAVVAAWMFAARRLDPRFPGNLVASLMCLLVLALLAAQPDVGMAVVVVTVWAVQFFIAGLPMAAVLGLGALFAAGAVGSYFTFGHVQSRVDRFLDPASGDSYQVRRSLEAFQNGGAFGTGPGEGVIKSVLPDAHADFVFAVAGEEFGVVATLLIVGLFAFVVLRGLARMRRENDLFVLIAVAGLLTQFGLQAVINMASTVHLIPTKGMTLPFISYGGSSMLALGLATGMVLALTRERAGGVP